MISAELPENEAERLSALQSFRILDTLPEEDYDNLVKIAAEICQTPISLISLVDDNRQWFKAKVGMEAQQTNRQVAVCAHNILTPQEPLIIPDMSADERFYDNPLVTDGIKMMFYAGIPLIDENGLALGSLCVIDNKPRQLNKGQINALKALSRQVMILMSNRSKNFLLEEQRISLELALENLNEFSAIVSHDLRAPMRLIGQYVEVIEEDFPEVITGELGEHLATIKNSANNANAMIIGVLRYCRSITALNNHQDPFRVNLLLRELIAEEVDPTRFEVTYPQQDIWLINSKMAVRQVFQNLIANAIKYHHKETGKIEITYESQPKYHFFSIKDDGPGIPKNYRQSIFRLFQTVSLQDKRESHGIGLSIVKKLVAGFGGKIWVESELGEGSNFCFTLAKQSVSEALDTTL